MRIIIRISISNEDNNDNNNNVIAIIRIIHLLSEGGEGHPHLFPEDGGGHANPISFRRWRWASPPR